jgi:hypothetical protein
MVPGEKEVNASRQGRRKDTLSCGGNGGVCREMDKTERVFK